MTARPTPLHAFLRGDGADGRGRTLAHILAQSDAWLEGTHDYIQWVFPLREPSAAVPGSPVLSAAAASAIRADPVAAAGLHAALRRMLAFYAASTAWHAAFDHNHLRITRMLTATADLLDPPTAAATLARLLALAETAGAAINPASLGYWRRAASV